MTCLAESPKILRVMVSFIFEKMFMLVQRHNNSQLISGTSKMLQNMTYFDRRRNLTLAGGVMCFTNSSL